MKVFLSLLLIISLISSSKANSVTTIGFTSTTCATKIGSIVVNENQCYRLYTCPADSCATVNNCAAQNSAYDTYKLCLGCTVTTGSFQYFGQGSGVSSTTYSDNACSVVSNSGSVNYNQCVANTGTDASCIPGEMYTSSGSATAPTLASIIVLFISATLIL